MNKTGERNINNFGSKMIIVKYKINKDIDIYFPQYNWTFKSARYDKFKNGSVRCPYEKRVFGVGYIGEGDYKTRENGKTTRVYQTWNNMLIRCYDEKYQEKRPTYKNCFVNEEWHNFQNFAKWYEENYYKVDGERMHLDKDILCKGNRVYSPEICIFVPQTINSLFTKCDNSRGESIIGVSYYKRYNMYQVHCSLLNPKTGKSKNKTLGYYNTQQKAFEVYKYHKEKNIKEVADYYKGLIPQKLYNGLYNYEVEITD